MGLRPACIQTSLRICPVWSGSMLFAISFYTCNRVGNRTAWILIRLRGCAGWSASMLVANTLRWFCHDAAHIWLHLYALLCLKHRQWVWKKSSFVGAVGGNWKCQKDIKTYQLVMKCDDSWCDRIVM
jgi:hypothetical protein